MIFQYFFLRSAFEVFDICWCSSFVINFFCMTLSVFAFTAHRAYKKCQTMFSFETSFKLAKEWKLFGIFRVPSVSCSTLFRLKFAFFFLSFILQEVY